MYMIRQKPHQNQQRALRRGQRCNRSNVNNNNDNYNNEFTAIRHCASSSNSSSSNEATHYHRCSGDDGGYGGSKSAGQRNYASAMPNCINYVRIFNNLLRTMMLIVFGLANLNNGLTSYVVKDNMNDELHRNINQKLIMSPSATFAGADGGSLLPSMTALVATSQLPYPPPAIISASSSSSTSLTSSAGAASSLSSTSLLSMSTAYQRPSGSSITSFDSTNVIDDRKSRQQNPNQHKHQHQQSHQHQHNRNAQLAKDTEARPLHRIVVGVGGSGGSDGAAVDASGNVLQNRLDLNQQMDGDEDIYGAAVAPMYFGTENSTVVTTQIGATAHIPCTVHHIGDGVVSWIRRKDYHLLTVGLTTYSSDERFSATHLKHSEDWTLQIKFVQLRDAGVYECQVSTHPPTSIFLHLNVVEARAEIAGPSIRYLTPGSSLHLKCRVVQNTEASEFIFWYHDNRMINYDIDRGINVSTDPDFQSSELTIQNTRREHSGNFTCVASNTQPASVLVHIFKGDNPAAMYHGHVGSSTKSYQTHLHSIMVSLALCYRLLHTRLHFEIA